MRAATPFTANPRVAESPRSANNVSAVTNGISPGPDQREPGKRGSAGAGARRPGITSKIRRPTLRWVGRIWIPIVMVIVVAVGVVTVSRLHGVFGSHQQVSDVGNADTIVAFNPKHVVYEIFGPAGTTATIDYLDADAQPREVAHATVPWSFPIETTLSAVVANVVAQGDSESLGCRIVVNGVVRAELLVNSHNAETTCLVKSA